MQKRRSLLGCNAAVDFLSVIGILPLLNSQAPHPRNRICITHPASRALSPPLIRMPDAESSPLPPLFTNRSWAVAGAPFAGSDLPPQADATAGLELFQAASETAADGYAAWKTAMAADKAAAQTQHRSSELPMHASADGFTRWKQETEEARRAFEKRWGIPPGKPVRVQLRGEPREREGILRLIEEPQGTSTRHLRLTLGGHTFNASQIESLVRI